MMPGGLVQEQLGLPGNIHRYYDQNFGYYNQHYSPWPRPGPYRRWPGMYGRGRRGWFGHGRSRDKDPEAFELDVPVTIKLTVCQARVKIDNDRSFYRMDPFVSITYKEETARSPATCLGGDDPFWNFKHELKNVLRLDDTIFIQVARTLDGAGPESKGEPLAFRELPIRELINPEDFEEKGQSQVHKWFHMVNKREHQCPHHSGQLRIKAVIDNPFFGPPELDMFGAHLGKPAGTEGKEKDDGEQTDRKYFVDSADEAEVEYHPSGESDNEVEALVLAGLAQPNDKERPRRCLMIYPNDRFKVAWDVVISVTLLVSCFITPVRIAFETAEDASEPDVLLAVLDAIFLIDIIINFNVAVEDEAYNIIDSRKAVAINYLKTWFAVDFVAILPIQSAWRWARGHSFEGPSGINSFLRIARLGKIYRLVKITRLVRIIKIVKQRGKFTIYLKSLLVASQGVENHVYSLLVFYMLCHVMACIWILTARMAGDEDGEGKHENWIYAKEYQDYDQMQLYVTAFYFTVATVTTVGYGDISGTNVTERIICIFLMIMGVIIFSISSGSITAIISNEEESNKQLMHRKNQLNNLYKQYRLPSELYLELLNAIKFNTASEVEELKEFIEALPNNLKDKVTMLIYSDNYKSITFLQHKPDAFINWLCPLFKPMFVREDQYVFYEEKDHFESMFFICRGQAAYVLPFRRNIVYVELQVGDDFGHVDVILSSITLGLPILGILQHKQFLKRCFTVQALGDIELLQLDANCII